jgi:hypothetical protein
MAKSALFAIKNATIVFFVAGTATEVDPATNNVVLTKTEISYSFYLETDGKPSNDQLPGSDRYARELVGYAVSPKKLDARIIRGTKCRIDYGRTSSEAVVRDIVFPYGDSGFGSLINNVLGDRVLFEQFWAA